MIVAWNDMLNHMKLEEFTENDNRWWNAAMFERNGKRLSIMTVCRIVDPNAKSVNSCKFQHKRKFGKIKRAKDIRDEMSKQLKNEIKDTQARYVLITGDFNEDVNTNNIQEFMVEMILHEVFIEIHEVDENNRDGTFAHQIKCIDRVLG